MLRVLDRSLARGYGRDRRMVNSPSSRGCRFLCGHGIKVHPQKFHHESIAPLPFALEFCPVTDSRGASNSSICALREAVTGW